MKPGVDRIPAEMCKIEGSALEFRIHDLIKLWKKEIIPKY
jgi:hypothetical protein